MLKRIAPIKTATALISIADAVYAIADKRILQSAFKFTDLVDRPIDSRRFIGNESLEIRELVEHESFESKLATR